MIYITGDTHGSIETHRLSAANFPDGKSLTKDDYVIICGDFGLIWSSSEEDLWWLKWLESKPWTTLFVDGNHENFDLLNSYPVELWNGGKIHKVSDSVIHLMRGQVFELQNHKFFTFGGAKSTDKAYRTEGKSWWKQEIPTRDEFDEALENLQEHEFSVDYIVTHTAPSWVCRCLSSCPVSDPTCDYMDAFDKFVKFKEWYFGHFHSDRVVTSEFHAMYENIERMV